MSETVAWGWPTDCDAQKVIDIASAEVGYLEKKSNRCLDSKTDNAGSANYTKYGRDMHQLYPAVMDFPAAWCDCFVDWCFHKAYGVANAKAMIGGNFDDYTVNSAQLYKNKGAWGTEPKFAAQIFFKNSTRICHTGLVTGFDDKWVETIEGNTSGASGVIANGGGVCRKRYRRNDPAIAGYGYPKYSDTPANTTTKKVSETPMKQIKKGSTGKAVKLWQVIIGVEVDGEFGPQTDVATRAFQRNHKLEVDGIVGPNTWKAGLESVK